MISCDRLALSRMRPIAPRWRLGGGDCKDQPTSADSLLKLVRNYTTLTLLVVWFDGILILLLEGLVRSIASSLTNRQEPEWHLFSGRWPAFKVRFSFLDRRIELKGHRIEQRSYRAGMGFDSDLTYGHTGGDVYKRTLPRGAPVLLPKCWYFFSNLWTSTISAVLSSRTFSSRSYFKFLRVLVTNSLPQNATWLRPWCRLWAEAYRSQGYPHQSRRKNQISSWLSWIWPRYVTLLSYHTVNRYNFRD